MFRYYSNWRVWTSEFGVLQHSHAENNRLIYQRIKVILNLIGARSVGIQFRSFISSYTYSGAINTILACKLASVSVVCNENVRMYVLNL
jgi:hypothetical protein